MPVKTLLTMVRIDKYNLEVYGDYKFEPVVKELLDSRSMQRLKHVQQHGPDSWVWEHANITRYEHCLGVFLLLRRLGAPLKEQIAGLIHDVSHCAFSHAVDFAFNKQLSADFHEKEIGYFIEHSDILPILDNYGYDTGDFFIDENYPLLEKDLPDLCADRIDYLFRDSYRYKLITLKDIKQILESLKVVNNEIIFSDEKNAFLFSKHFLEAAGKIFGSAESIFFHTKMGNAIKIGLDKGILTKEDLFTTDENVRMKLLKSDDKEILEEIGQISRSVVIKKTEKGNHDYNLKVKVRAVDPKVFIGNKAIRLSAINSEYKNLLKDSIKKQQEGYYVKIIKR